MGLLASHKQVHYMNALLVERDTSEWTTKQMRKLNKVLEAEVKHQFEVTGIIQGLLKSPYLYPDNPWEHPHP